MPKRRLWEHGLFKGGLRLETSACEACSGVGCLRVYRTRSEPALAVW